MPVTPTLRPRRSQRGLSIVETMVGVTVGLFVVAAAAMLVSSQLSSNRRLLLDTQLQQDLRAAADIVTRELRRAGARSDNSGQAIVWTTAKPDVNVQSLASSITLTGGSQVSYLYERQAGSVIGYGFKLENNVLKTLVASEWQELTDKNVLKVTGFTIAPSSQKTTTVPCPNVCPAPATPPVAPDTAETWCWPQTVVRTYSVTIVGEAANDPSISRSVTSMAHVRNDRIVNRLVPSSTTKICP